MGGFVAEEVHTSNCEERSNLLNFVVYTTILQIPRDLVHFTASQQLNFEWLSICWLLRESLLLCLHITQEAWSAVIEAAPNSYLLLPVSSQRFKVALEES